MPTLIYPNTGAKLLAVAMQTLLAESKLRLFKDNTVVVSPATTLAELVAAECDYTGYASGGIEITAFNDPILAPEGGYAIGSPIVQFMVGATPTVTNLVGGWFLVSDAPALAVACQLDDAVPMQIAGQGFPVDVRLVFRNG